MDQHETQAPDSDREDFVLERVLEPGTDFHIEEAGDASDGTPLFAVYRREPNQKET